MRFLLIVMFLFVSFGCSAAGGDSYPRRNSGDSCTAGNDTWIEFDNNEHVYLLPGDFKQEQIDMIKSAAAEWNKATNGLLNMTFQIGYEYPFMFNSDLDTPIIGTEWSDKDHKPVISVDVASFNYPDENGNVVWHPNAFRETTMHEIGHGYGLVHHNGPGILMNPSITGINCIDWDTVEQFCLHRSCPNGFTTTCTF